MKSNDVCGTLFFLHKRKTVSFLYMDVFFWVILVRKKSAANQNGEYQPFMPGFYTSQVQISLKGSNVRR